MPLLDILYLLGKINFPSSSLYSCKLATWVVSCISNPMTTMSHCSTPPILGVLNTLCPWECPWEQSKEEGALTIRFPGQLTRV